MEYQISLNAFLNWLVDTDRLIANPLAKVSSVETRGQQVRASRAFTDDELRRLFAVARHHLLGYQVLLDTGQRRSEVRSLVWGDLHLDGEKRGGITVKGACGEAGAAMERTRSGAMRRAAPREPS